MKSPIALLGAAVALLGLPLGAPARAATQSSAEPAAESAYVLDAVEVNAAREREIAYLAIRDALERHRSDRPEDADQLVCQRVNRDSNTLFKDVRCTSNRGWWYERKVSMQRNSARLASIIGGSNGAARAFAEAAIRSAAFAPYPVTEPDTMWTLSMNHYRKLAQEFEPRAAADPARLKTLIAEHRTAQRSDEHGTPAQTVVRFARAFAAVSAAGDDEARATRAIEAAGLTLEEYNALVERLEASERFRNRVEIALLEWQRQ